MAPGEEETKTHELLVEQSERERDEGDMAEGSELPDEVDQHERRRDKAAYLKEKLAEREESERKEGS